MFLIIIYYLMYDLEIWVIDIVHASMCPKYIYLYILYNSYKDNTFELYIIFIEYHHNVNATCTFNMIF